MRVVTGLTTRIALFFISCCVQTIGTVPADVLAPGYKVDLKGLIADIGALPIYSVLSS